MSTIIDLPSVSAITLLIIYKRDDRNNNMCYGKLLENVSPVCDTADLHVSTLYQLSLLRMYVEAYETLSH